MDLGFMATKMVAAKSEPAGTAMLEQLADLDADSISPATASRSTVSSPSIQAKSIPPEISGLDSDGRSPVH
jgi:hypothetical protein